MQAAIVVQDLGKRYRARDRGRPSSLKGRILSGYRAPASAEFWGLRHISFNIARGRAVGVVGLNGAGKSTLLRLIGGVGVADEGSVRTNGRIGALLEIGAGLTEDLTGRENVYLLGVISGMLRSEVRERFDEIVAFAELTDFIDAPVRTYSTGMRMRLAFAVAINTAPDILLIDEVLAVGDLAFQRKCMRRVDEIRASGCTIFLVSHDDAQIRALCDDVIFLDRGRMVAHGPLEETMALYGSSVDAKDAASESQAPPLPPPSAQPGLEPEVNRFGSGEMLITAVALTDDHGRPRPTITVGEGVRIHIRFDTKGREEQPIVVVGLYAPDDTACLETNTQMHPADIAIDGTTGSVTLRIDRLDLAPEEYRWTIGLFSPDWNSVWDYHAEAYPFRVVGIGQSKGYLNPPLSWMREVPADEAAGVGG